jgi:DNA-binding MarR family transcriptional regulator
MSEERLPSRPKRFCDRTGLQALTALFTFFNLVRTAASGILDPLKLSNDELLVLICLAHSDSPVSMGAIERSTLLQPGRLRRAVDRLEAQRLLVWRRSRADRRKILVRLKKPGLQLINDLAPIMFELVDKVAKALGEHGTEFMRAKMRKVVSTAGAPEGTRCEHTPKLALQPQIAGEQTVRATQRPITWGLAGWLRWCQLSSLMDALWRVNFPSLGITQPQLQVLASLSDAGRGLTIDAIVSETGLPQPNVVSNLTALEKAGLVTNLVDESLPGRRLARHTPKGAYVVLESLPLANRLAADLYQGLGDNDLEQLLALVRKACGAAWQVKQHYTAAQPPTSVASAQ